RRARAWPGPGTNRRRAADAVQVVGACGGRRRQRALHLRAGPRHRGGDVDRAWRVAPGDMTLPPIISLAEIRVARERLRGTVLRTPVVALRHDAGLPDVRLKLENLQPIGSFKLRGAGNAMRAMTPESLGAGVWTASAGNMA